MFSCSNEQHQRKLGLPHVCFLTKNNNENENYYHASPKNNWLKFPRKNNFQFPSIYPNSQIPKTNLQMTVCQLDVCCSSSIPCNAARIEISKQHNWHEIFGKYSYRKQVISLIFITRTELSLYRTFFLNMVESSTLFS